MSSMRRVELERGGRVPNMKRLLVVDDSRAIRSYLEVHLSPYFYVTLIDNGQDAISLAQEEPFSLVLSDVNMPHLSGFQLHEKLRQLKPQLPVVLMTDADIDHYLGDAMSYRVQHIFAKAAFRADFDCTRRLLNQLSEPARFGMERYLGSGGEVRSLVVGAWEELPGALEQCQRLLQRFPRHDVYQRMLPLLVESLLAPVDAGTMEAGPPLEGQLVLSVGADWQRVGFGVRDEMGLLTHHQVLEQLTEYHQHRQPSLLHSHGLLQARWMVDSSVLTLVPGQQTELLCFDLLQGYKGHRSLHVHELTDERYR
ncbi:MAG: response regulator [Myxococcota bacterium]